MIDLDRKRARSWARRRDDLSNKILKIIGVKFELNLLKLVLNPGGGRAQFEYLCMQAKTQMAFFVEYAKAKPKLG